MEGVISGFFEPTSQENVDCEPKRKLSWWANARMEHTESEFRIPFRTGKPTCPEPSETQSLTRYVYSLPRSMFPYICELRLLVCSLSVIH